MPEYTHPEARTQKSLDVKDDDATRILQLTYDAIDARSEWEVELREVYRRRMGDLEEKNWPWPNCANLNIPLTEKMIRRQKPVLVNAVFGTSTIVNYRAVGSTDRERAQRVEIGYDWLVKERMRNSMKNLIYAVDNQLTYGFGYIMPIWDYRTERVTVVITGEQIRGALEMTATQVETLKNAPEDQQTVLAPFFGYDLSDSEDAKAFKAALKQFRSGKDPITTSYQRVSYNAPLWVPVAVEDIIVPWDATDEIDDLPWFAHRRRIRREIVKENGDNGLWDPDAADEASKVAESPSETSPNTQMLLQAKAQYERVHRFQGSANHVEIYEWYGWKDINNDGLSERVVYTVSPRTQKVLRAIEYPYFHGQWPLVKLNMEIRENRWYASRGIPKLLEDIQGEINAQHNAKLDRLAIQNSLTFKMREGAIKNPKNVTFRPGTFIPVRRMEDLDPISYQVMDFSYDAEVRALKSEAEELIGAIDLSQINARVERRTATEVDTINDVSDQILSLDVSSNQREMRRLHMQTLQLWEQYGDEEVMDRVDVQGRAVRLQKADLRAGYDLVPAGRLDNSNSSIRMRNLIQDFQVASMPQVGPYIVWYELVKDYFNARDYQSAQRYVQPSGALQQGAINQQVAELLWMDKISQVHPVDIGDAHEIHIQTVQQAMPKAQEEQKLLYSGHAVLHMIAMGDTSLIETVQSQFNVQIKQVGSKWHMIRMDEVQPPAQAAQLEGALVG